MTNHYLWQGSSKTLRFSAIAFAILTASPSPSLASAAKTTNKPDYRDGVLLGRIVDPSGKPIPNATVAVKIPNSKTLFWTKTDATGEYVLCVKPKLALNLEASKSRGLLEQCVRAVGDVAMAPVRIVGDVVTQPGTVVKSAAVSVASGNPGPLVMQGVAAGLPNGSTPSQTSETAGGAAADAILSGPTKGGMPDPPARGQATVLVIADGFKSAAVNDAAYWLDCPNDDKKHPLGVQARMQTIKMIPNADAKDKPAAVPQVVQLSNAVANPTLVPIGADLDLQVSLTAPMPDSQTQIRVFARLGGRDSVDELKAVAGKPGLYEGNILIDKKCKAGPAIISIGALRSTPIEVKLNPKKVDALAEFARRTPDMDCTKKYGYDPFVMASVNRLDLKVNILPAKSAG